MNTKLLLFSRLRRASLGAVGCAVIGVLAASCGQSDNTCQPGVSSKLVSERFTTSPRGRVDLVLAIDNSRSMADKQQILALAVPDLVRGLVNPPCVDQATGLVSSTPDSPLAPCPQGSKRKLDPIVDLHVGILSSSLGGHGSDACATGAGKASNNDRAHLLDRKDPTTAETVATYQALGFLAWDPVQKLSPPGEADIDVDSAGDTNTTALVPQLRDLVMGVGQIGCGYEAQLESWYRFLIDPSPPESITLDAEKRIVLNGIDKFILDQRKAFLRPDSLLAIMMLSDENDCSIRESGQFYFAAQQKTGNGTPFHLPKARAVCDVDPNNECCFSCGQTGPKDDTGNPICAADPTCQTPEGKTAYHDETTDNINLRCFDQKRRFGIDFLYPIDRYSEALQSPTVADRNGNLVPNPIFSDLDPTDDVASVRSSGMVMLAAITGVPWQDIARTNANGFPDLKAGLDFRNTARGGFKSASEMMMTLPGKEYSTWDLILGDPDAYPDKSALPKDPHMIESVEPRTGTNPLTGDALAPPSQPLSDMINGNEWTIAKHDDLQYACVFPLVKVDPSTGDITPDVRPCDPPGVYPGCDCEDKSNDNPLCQAAASGDPTDQVRAKAYPGLRELSVVKALGGQGIVASVCPAQLHQPEDVDFGYRPAIAALLDRLTYSTSGSCFPHALPADENGQVECLIIEATRAGAEGATACNACEQAARTPVTSAHQGAVDEILQENPASQFDCFCEIPQLSGSAPDGALHACQNDTSETPVLSNGQPVDGYCYVDAESHVGNPAIVEKCPAEDPRLLRFVGAGAPTPGSTVFLWCVVEKTTGSTCSGDKTLL